MSMRTGSQLSLLCLSLCGTLLVGCSQKQPQSAADPLFANTETHLVNATLDTQTARGVRNDATLYPAHFAGVTLSGLGRDKLARMLRDNDTPLPLVVYVDLPANDTQANGRREAVQAYLADIGLLAGQYKIEAGPNPQTLHPIAPELARMAKSEGTEGNNQPAEAPSIPNLSDLARALPKPAGR